MEHMAHGDEAPAVALPPGTIRHPGHGAYLGHILPGTFFILWGTFWLISVIRLYLKSNSRSPFQSRAWYEFPRPKSVPLEPLLKIVLTFIGINGELWAGQPHFRYLFEEDGRFVEHHLQDWQHSAMYLAFLLSGVVDLMAHYIPALPQGVDHASLSIAILIEGLLFAFHLQGYALDVRVHTLLVLTILTTFVVVLGELRYRSCFLLALARPMLLLQQGIWFWQVAHILFKDNMAWDPDYHGSVMMVPVIFVCWWLVVMVFTLTVFCAMLVYYQRIKKTYRPLPVFEGKATNGHASPRDMTFSKALNEAERD